MSPSRNSTASLVPTEAPDGTAALPKTPDSNNTSSSTVGLPRESRISRAITSTIALILCVPLFRQSIDFKVVKNLHFIQQTLE